MATSTRSINGISKVYGNTGLERIPQKVSIRAGKPRGLVTVKSHTRKAPKAPRAKAPRAHRPRAHRPRSLTAPLTYGQAVQQANAAANAQYGPQIQQAQYVQSQTPGWFDQYRASVAQAQQQTQAMAKPLLQAANAGVSAAGQVAPGAADNPDAQLAAQARQELATLGLNMLQSVNANNQNYMSGLRPISYQQQMQQQTSQAKNIGALKSARGAAATKALGDIRAQEQNTQIANQTLGLNQAKAVANEQDKAASRRVTIRGQNKTARNQAAGRRERQREADQRNQTTQRGQDLANTRAQQRTRQQQQQKNAVTNRHVKHAMQRIHTLRTQGPVNVKTGTNPDGTPKIEHRKLTDQEIRQQLHKEGYSADEIQSAMNSLHRRNVRRRKRQAGMHAEMGHRLSPGMPGQGSRPT